MADSDTEDVIANARATIAKQDTPQGQKGEGGPVTDKPCKECGAPMLHLDATTEVCSRLNDLMVRRFNANDRRPVSHASLAEVPDVVVADLGAVVADRPGAAAFSMGVVDNAFDWDAAAQRMKRAGVVLDCVGSPELDITHLALTDRGPELGGVVKSTRRLTVKCDACGDVRAGTCGAEDCPVPMQIDDAKAPG